tara:strand:- start:9 stop:152 length:144 start_codon:yes stop_codon:yes gene_type:complete
MSGFPVFDLSRLPSMRSSVSFHPDSDFVAATDLFSNIMAFIRQTSPA